MCSCFRGLPSISTEHGSAGVRAISTVCSVEHGADAMLVGVVPAALVVDHLPREPHDISMGFMATEEGVIAVA